MSNRYVLTIGIVLCIITTIVIVVLLGSGLTASLTSAFWGAFAFLLLLDWLKKD